MDISILIYSLALILSIYAIVIPYWQGQTVRAEREFNEDFRSIKLRALKRRYPALREMSYREIEEEYNVDHLYYNL